MAKERLSIVEGELKLQSGPLIIQSLLDIIGLYVQQAQQIARMGSIPNSEEIMFYVDQAVRREAKYNGRDDKRDQFLRLSTTHMNFSGR